MKKYLARVIITIIMLGVLMLPAASAFAIADKLVITGIKYGENDITLLFQTEAEYDSVSVRIDDQSVPVENLSTVGAENPAMSIVFLVDASASVPKEMRDRLADLAGELIETKGVECQYAVMSFGNNIQLLQDFTHAQYKVEDAIAGISYSGKNKRLYDGLSSAVRLFQDTKDISGFAQIFVMTAGNNDRSSEISQEEVSQIIEESHIPVNTVLLSKSKEAAQEEGVLKQLEEWAAVTGGKLVVYSPDMISRNVSSELLGHINSTGVARIPYQAFPDGHFDDTVELTAWNQGSAVAACSVRLAFERQALPVVFETPEEKPPVQPVITPKETDKNRLTAEQIYLFGGIVLAIAAILVAVITIIRRNNKRKLALRRAEEKEVREAAVVSSLLVKLQGIDGTGGSFSQVIRQGGSVRIGRNPNTNDIVIKTDRQVSGNHCTISFIDGNLIIADVGSKNGTYLNNVRLETHKVISNHDILKIGKQSFRIMFKRL